ncbi:MAG: hypothetical protein KKH68_11445 [Proteobacteria bacterium]|nr:hypothetical protein [Pseudomonadota bacterium]
MLEKMKSLAESRVDFAIETTLSGKAYVHFLQDLKSMGLPIYYAAAGRLHVSCLVYSANLS